MNDIIMNTYKDMARHSHVYIKSNVHKNIYYQLIIYANVFKHLFIITLLYRNNFMSLRNINVIIGTIIY